MHNSEGGEEVDIVIDLGDRVVPVEVKSSGTFRSDFLRGLGAFRRVVPLSQATPGVVAFNGHAAAGSVGGVLLANPLDGDFAGRIFGIWRGAHGRANTPCEPHRRMERPAWRACPARLEDKSRAARVRNPAPERFQK